ncbi:DnaJ sub B member 5 [Blomia tropicalis]|nr:DnaJ sub B member 5 [Blomia tropicalis]
MSEWNCVSFPSNDFISLIMDSLKEAYSILGVDSDSTLEQIEKVYWEKFEEIVSEKIFNRALLNQIKNAYDQITKDRRLKEPPSNANMDVINDNERFENENVNMEIDTVDSFDSIKSNEQFNHSYYDDINTNGLDNKHETEENDCEMIEEKSKEIENSTKKCPPPIEHKLFVTLEELKRGCLKTEMVIRQIFQNGKALIEKKPIRVKIKIGTKIGETIIVEEKGHQWENCDIKGDIHFIVQALPHNYFRPLNIIDLECIVNITMTQLNSGFNLDIPSLDSNGPINFEWKGTIINFHDEMLDTIKKRGLPYLDGNQRKMGDLIVKYDLVSEQAMRDGITKLKKVNKDDSNFIENSKSEFDIFMTLDDVMFGAKKEFTINQKVEKNNSCETEEKTFLIEIPPGAKSKFERDGTDLVYRTQVTREQVDKGEVVNIPQIGSKEPLSVVLDNSVIQEGKIFYGRGLPYPIDQRSKGCLIVRFELVNQAVQYEKSDKLPTNRYDLELSLKELFTGCKQTLPVVRKKLDGTFETIQKEVDVEAGTLNGTIIYFENEGDQGKVRDYDLEISSSIDEQQAKNGCELNVPTIEGTEIPVYFEPGVTTRTTKRIPNYGLLKPDKTRGQTIIRPLSLTLEQIQTGLKRKVQINRKVYNFRKDCSELKCEFATIIIPPGAPDKYEFVLENFADESKGSMPGDLIYVVQMKPHDIFKRDGANLLYRKKIYECLLCRSISIPRLGMNEPIEFLIEDDFNRKNPIKRFGGCGLPKMNEESKNGDLIVQLDIMHDPSTSEYPLWLSLEDVMNGVENKQIDQIERLFINVDGSQEKRKETVIVSIEPGIENGTIITIPWAEEENESFVAFDINLKVQDKPHSIFERSGADIIYKMKMILSFMKWENASQEKIIELDILPGHKPGHEFKFIRMGDEHKGRIPADVIFKVFAKPHEHFKANGYNLFYSHKVNRSEIDKGNYTFMVPTLDGDPIEQTIPSRLRNKTIKINGYGLPKMSFKSSIRGDIVVNLDIKRRFRNKKQNSKEAIDKHTKDVEKTTQMSPIENEKESVDKVSNSTKPPIIINMPVTIEQVMTGTIIEKEFVQEIMNENSQIINKITKLYKIEIEPGCQLSFITIPVKKPGEYEFIENFGLPNPAEAGKRGLLIVKFIFDPNYQSENINPIQNMVRNGDSVLNFLYSEALKRNTPNQNGFQSSYNLESSFPSVQYNNNYKSNQNIMVKAGCVNTGTPFSYSDAAKQIVDFPKSINPKNSPNYSFNNINSISNNSGMVENNSLKRVKEIDLFLSLEEVLNGCTKEKLLNRKIVEEDQYEHIEEKQFKIDIAPGIVENERITFKNAGDQLYGQEADDIVFVVKMEEHPIFKRNGANIIMSYKSDRKNAGKTVTLPKLDKPGHFKTKAPKHSNECTNYPGLGLPHPDKPVRGMLIVNWIFFGESKKFWFNKYF